MTEKLLLNPFSIYKIKLQVSIRKLISREDFNFFDEEIQKHKFDFVIYRKFDTIAVEVNYKHGEKADRKSNNIFKPTLERYNIKLVTIDDYDCRSLFKLNENKEHKITTDDLRDILDAFDKAKINLE